MSTATTENILNEVFGLIEKHGESEYFGEPVSIKEHMIQCAMLAEEENYSKEVILGAFFHDFGHFLQMEGKQNLMIVDGVVLGTSNHEKIAAEYLEARNFSPIICNITRHHVNAKRYLVFKNKSYYESLTEASKQTLQLQGGVMSEEEAGEFERQPMFDLIIQARKWDEEGKDPNKVLKPIEYYRNMCAGILKK
ncbi:Hypothetical predicted protein [Octopus vulgaris]|uniref:HD domain-containing protein n=1 Tax=Octopus vulgaris TaxID=6645 RepID=A0AA36BAL6_OCTVU|nr:Hypothetical predicted protein [Octopus vulgaris]